MTSYGPECHNSKARSSFATVFPLTLCYVAFPLSGIVTHSISSAFFKAWIDVAWVFLALVCAALLPLGRGEFRRIRFFWNPIWLVLLICLARASVAVLTETKSLAFYPLAMELKPCLYLIFTFVWINRFGIPSTEDFIRFGTYLSTIITCEFLVTSVVTHSIARPAASGEINYDACLLLLPFALAINAKTKRRNHLLIIGLGLLCTFSRTAQATAVILALVSGGMNLMGKVSVASGALLGINASFSVRSLSTNVSGGDRVFMWNAAMELFKHDPLGFLLGYDLGAPLNVAVPRQLRGLWDQQARGVGVHGVFAFNFHSMWLRLIISWGLVTVLPMVAILLYWVFSKRSKLAMSVIIIIFVEGLTMGVFYLSNVAVPLLLFMLLVGGLARKTAALRGTMPREGAGTRRNLCTQEAS